MITPFLFQAISYGTLLLHFDLSLFCTPFLILISPETAGRSLEQMDTFFEHGNCWNIFKTSHRIREEGIDDWRSTKKLKAEDHTELGQGSKRGTTVQSPGVDQKEAQQSWKKRTIYTFRRKASNAGLM